MSVETVVETVIRSEIVAEPGGIEGVVERVVATELVTEELGPRGTAGVSVLDVGAVQADDGTVTLRFVMSSGEVHTVSFLAGHGGLPPAEVDLEASATGRGTAAADLLAALDLRGSTIGTGDATATATLSTWAALAGTAEARALATGLLMASLPVSGAAVGRGLAAAEPALAVGASGMAAGRGFASGSMSATLGIAGAAVGRSTAAAQAALALQFSGAAVARAQASGFLTLGNDLALQASVTARGTASGLLALDVTIAGVAAGRAFASGALAASLDVVGGGIGRGTAAGTIMAARDLAGSASGAGLASAAISLQAPSAAFSDDFNRADQTLGTSPNWNRSGGSAGVASIRDGMIAFTGAGEPDTLYFAPSTGSANHFAQLQSKMASGISLNGFPLVVCAIDENNFIGLRPRSTNWQALSRVNGAFTVLNSGGSMNLDDFWRAEVIEGQVRFYRNGALSLGPFSVPSALLTATRVGLVVRADSRNPVGDNWQSGAL